MPLHQQIERTKPITFAVTIAVVSRFVVFFAQRALIPSNACTDFRGVFGKQIHLMLCSRSKAGDAVAIACRRAIMPNVFKVVLPIVQATSDRDAARRPRRQHGACTRKMRVRLTALACHSGSPEGVAPSCGCETTLLQGPRPQTANSQLPLEPRQTPDPSGCRGCTFRAQVLCQIGGSNGSVHWR